MTKRAEVRKNSDKLRDSLMERIAEHLDSGYQDLGGGDSIFLPIPALEAVRDYCEKELNDFEERTR